MRKKNLESILYIVSTPIGNADDISLRALKVVKQVDAVICEELKEGALFLKTHNITNELEQLNEHNEQEHAPELIERLLAGESFALISDCGTPVFADPGRHLLQLALEAGINIVVIPGASSLMTALVRSGFNADRFTSAGFLSRKSEERTEELFDLSFEPRTVVLMETPYRLLPVLESAKKVMPNRKAYIGCNLTMPYESHHYGTFSELHAKFTENKFKGEFVIVFEGNSDTESKFYQHYEARTGYKEEPEVIDKPAKNTSTEKKSFNDLDFTPADQVQKDDNESSDRNEKRSYDRDDKRRTFGRDDKKRSFGRDDKKRTFGRDDKKRSYGSDDKKRSYGSDDKKRSYGSDDSKRSFGRDDKKRSYGSDDKKRSYGSDDKKRSFGRDDKKRSYGSDDRKRSYSNGKDSRSYDRSENKSRFGSDDKKEGFDNKKKYASFDEVGGGLEAPKRRTGGKPRIYNDRNKPKKFGKR